MSYAVKNLIEGNRELIALRIGDQEFCVNITAVREIRGWTPAIPLPRTSHDIWGVTNLRGVVLPIIDLSMRLGLKPAEPTVRHVIVVAQVKSQHVGLLVDAVSDVLTVTENDIQPVPELCSDFERQYARGILAVDRRMICLIELGALISDAESEAA